MKSTWETLGELSRSLHGNQGDLFLLNVVSGIFLGEKKVTSRHVRHTSMALPTGIEPDETLRWGQDPGPRQWFAPPTPNRAIIYTRQERSQPYAARCNPHRTAMCRRGEMVSQNVPDYSYANQPSQSQIPSVRPSKRARRTFILYRVCASADCA
jgi:hypothetical protein